MDNSPLLLLLSAASGAIITSLIGPYFTQSKERRSARAQVLQAIVSVEALRWGDSEYSDLNKAVASLKAAGLIARADRKLIEYYVWLALVSHRSGEETNVGEDENVWLVPSELVKHIDNVISSLSFTLWYPARTRPFRSFIYNRLKKQEKTVRKQSSSIYWDGWRTL